MAIEDWIVPNFYKTSTDSLFDQEFDYFVSLGHRCCVGQSLNYMRKSSFPFDWQITPIDVLPTIFKNEFKDFYPDSGVNFAHVLHKKDETGIDLPDVDVERTFETYNRRSKRLVKLIKENKRRLLFVRHKYTDYWSRLDNEQQLDAKPIEHDIKILEELSDILKTQYNNDKFQTMYIYQKLDKFSQFDWDPQGRVGYETFTLPDTEIQCNEAMNFTYTEQYGWKDKNITPIVVDPGEVRVEGNAIISSINSFIKLSDVQDFELPYGFEEKVLTRNIDNE